MDNFIETNDDSLESESENEEENNNTETQSPSLRSPADTASVSDSQQKMGNIKMRNVFHICAMCCRGPAQEGLHKRFELSAGTSLSSCSACHSASFCSKGTDIITIIHTYIH
jgi:hypothetical protein